MDGEDTSQPRTAAGGDQQEPKVQTIDLKLLSPSPEVPASGLFLENLPTTTTLGELRGRITAALPSRPPPARQRLIYFGRVLQRDEDTLASVFGENSVRQQRQHTLHLVLPLRDGSSQREAAPSPVPSVRASIYPPSSIPRPSSVPPRGTGAASPFRGPVSWQPHAQPPAPTPAPSATTSTNTTASPAPQRPSQGSQPPLQQPQPRTQAVLDQPIFRSVIGNANIRANITANGQPINLPPEVVNQLLNQHFLRNGGLEHLLPSGQTRSQSADQTTQSAGASPSGPTSQPLQSRSSGQQLFQQFMASVGDTNRQAQNTGGDAGSPQDRPSDTESEERGRSMDSQASARHAPDPPASVPSTSATDSQQPSSSNSQHPPNGSQSNGPSPTIREQSGVNPDGSRWSIRTVENHHPFAHPYAHFAQQLPQIPIPMPLPQGFAFAPFQTGQGFQMPVAVPVAGLRPHGTPRSVSPARSVSDGPRRVGTPAAELQHRLMHTNLEIQNLNQLLGALATGTNADGQPAPALTEEQLSQIRAFAQSMNAHIDGFGHELNALANAHPNVRFQPEFAGLSAMFHTLQGQGRGVSQRIDALAGSNAASAESLPRAEPSTAATPAAPQEQATVSPESVSNPDVSVSQSTPSTTTDTSPETNTTTYNASPACPELHLLSDPTNTQHYLLIGPSGPLGTGQLPLDVLYPLLAAQLPHDQLIRDFNRAAQEMTYALQRADLRTALQAGLSIPLASQGRSQSSRIDSNATNTSTARASVIGIGQHGQTPAAGPAHAQPQQQPAPPAGPARAVQGQARQQPDEMRDVLAPIVRNLWLIVRLCIFGWFFFSSGRGYGRLLILLVLGGLVWGINAGIFGQRLNGLLDSIQRHFQEVVDEARGNRPNEQQQTAPGNNAGEGSSRAAGFPTPEETARRLMVQQAEGQRRRMRDTLRQIERTIALALASLWPGVGEAVVRNHERARREAERAAEERRRAEEEEARKRSEAEEEKKAKDCVAVGTAEGSTSVNRAGGAERVNKGKEKADSGDVD
ncbi:uncharacterized protein PV09_04101 [Verruconis gallopava]|uniref:Ubiquitin-like domain-containing protein n=1 Tax=Verruconis gallopava TaxID=253628 RepID=A0A0D1XQM0_9PEZI|nr:uncharacterized protein PV09_04101 [Verruconis gallopava]KIW04936.1 hypothetical protein PV09_04101 [Verruconis gallopava]